MNLAQQLAQGCEKLGVKLEPEIQQKMLNFVVLLEKWNRVYNLTAIRSIEQMISYHLLDSLSVLPYLWPGKWLDVGCGAGVPGIVLAIAQPEWSFTLLDSNSKKTSFVQQAVIELDLKNVTVKCSRVEELKPAEKYDGIISRAFADTKDFINLTRQLLAENGKWAAMKGTPDQELQYLPGDVMVDRAIPLNVPGLNAARCLVLLKAI